MLAARIFACCLLFSLGCSSVVGASARVLKVLPHYLDLEGRHSLSPSLYERDAYQAYLRKNPGQCSGLRFDVQWKASGLSTSNLTLRLELRTSQGSLGKPSVLEQQVKPNRWFSTWSSVKLDDAAYRILGNVIAWRATLWSGGNQVAEQKSFLW